MKILVIIVSRIGDTLLTTPSIRAIKQKYPDSKLTVLAHPKRYQVLKNLPFIDKLGKITKRSALFKGYLSGNKYDLAFVYGFDMPLISYAIRISNKTISFTQKDNSINKNLYKEVSIPDFNDKHVIYQLATLVQSVGISVDNGRLSYEVSNKEEMLANKIIDKIANKDEIKIGLQVAGFPTKQNRNWTIENFISLCQQLVKKVENVKFILFGSNYDKTTIDKLTRVVGDKSCSVAGQYSLRESAAIMSKVDLYIGVDTGPTHIVGAFDIPIIALYRSTCPSALTGILNHTCYYPVDHPRSYNCDVDMPMDEITVDAVFRKVVDVLNSCLL